MGFKVLHLARVVRQYPAKYFSMLSVFNLLKFSRVFTLFVGRFFKAGKNAKLYYVISNILQLGKLSFTLVPDMVLSNTKNHENWTKQTYERYTFLYEFLV